MRYFLPSFPNAYLIFRNPPGGGDFYHHGNQQQGSRMAYGTAVHVEV